jgi:hypothetical protein
VGSGVLVSAREVKWGLMVRRWGLWNSYFPLRKRLEAAPSVVSVSMSKLNEDLKTLKLLSTHPKIRAIVATHSGALLNNLSELAILHQQLHELTKDVISCPKCGYQFIKE